MTQRPSAVNKKSIPAKGDSAADALMAYADTEGHFSMVRFVPDKL